MRVLWILGLLLPASCHQRQGATIPHTPMTPTAGIVPSQYDTSCTAQRPANAVPFDTAQWPLLRGRFWLETIDTSMSDRYRWREELELHRPDSATRFYTGYRSGNRLDAAQGEILLQGRVYRGADTAVTLNTIAEVERTVLFIGCRNCADGSPTYYRIQGVTSDGFWGRWVNNQTGLAQRVDADFKRTPDPAGFYCARRIPTER